MFEFPAFDLDAWLRRVGLEHRPQPTAAGLAEATNAQSLAIPFENLDPLFRRPVSLRPQTVFEKIVSNGRGGYCFELNTLLAGALSSLGFKVTHRLGRVFSGPGAAGPRTHHALLVPVAGTVHLVDVGFGGPGATAPLPWEPGPSICLPGAEFRLIDDPGFGRVLERRFADGWRPLYALPDEPAHEADFESACHVAATWPGSPFPHAYRCARQLGEGKLLQFEGPELVLRSGASVDRTKLRSGVDIAEALENRFGIRLDAELRDAVAARGAA